MLNKFGIILLFVIGTQLHFNNALCVLEDNPYTLLKCISISPQILIGLIQYGNVNEFCDQAQTYMGCIQGYVKGCIGGEAAKGILEELMDLNRKCCISTDLSQCVSTNPEIVKNCFALDNMITLADNTKKQLADAKVGDVVKSVDSNGNIIDAEIVALLHKETDQLTKFLNFESENGQQISLTSGHLINIKNKGYVKASTVKVGDIMTVSNGDNLVESEIVTITTSYKNGYIAPLTESGTILVNGVHASCYAEVNSHELANVAMKPLTLWYKMSKYLGATDANENENGIHYYAKVLHDLSANLFPSLLI